MKLRKDSTLHSPGTQNIAPDNINKPTSILIDNAEEVQEHAEELTAIPETGPEALMDNITTPLAGAHTHEEGFKEDIMERKRMLVPQQVPLQV